MSELSDAELLRDYAERRNEAAFRELVTRHADLVYSAALRQVESPDLASDVAQAVFTDLAHKARSVAGQLAEGASLMGWLYRGTRFASLNQLRADRRRLTHERQAMEQLLTNSEPAPDWERIRPLLDEAIASLGDEDRDAVLLRYFKRQEFLAVGGALGISDDAAQKRVSRAVERLREFFAKRGVTLTGAAIAGAVSANAIQAVPLGLAAKISSAAVLAGTTLAATATATKAMAMTALQKTLVTATVAALAGVGIYQARQAAQLRDQVQTLQQQNEQLRPEGEGLSNHLKMISETIAPPAPSLPEKQFNELLRLRGEVGLLRRQLAAAEATPKPPTNHIVFPGLYLSREAWSDHGTDEPRNTILTMFWALRQGDQSKLEQLVSPMRGSLTLDQLTFPRDDWEKISAIQLAGTTVTRGPTAPPTAAVSVIVEKAPPVGETDRDVSFHRWILTEGNDQWLIMRAY